MFNAKIYDRRAEQALPVKVREEERSDKTVVFTVLESDDTLFPQGKMCHLDPYVFDNVFYEVGA